MLAVFILTVKSSTLEMGHANKCGHNNIGAGQKGLSTGPVHADTTLTCHQGDMHRSHACVVHPGEEGVNIHVNNVC